MPRFADELEPRTLGDRDPRMVQDHACAAPASDVSRVVVGVDVDDDASRRRTRHWGDSAEREASLWLPIIADTGARPLADVTPGMRPA